MRRAAWLAWLGILMPGFAAAHSLSLAELNNDITRNGAAAVVTRLAAGQGAAWNRVIADISSGRATWLDVAVRLAPGTDAGTAEDIDYALSSALLHNPEGVLQRLYKPFGLKDICVVPLIEPTDAQVAAWQERAVAALARVKTPQLQSRAAACRAAILQP
jgi:hypothetical protein